MIDLRRMQAKQIAQQVRTFLKSPPTPRMHAQIDPEKGFSTPAFGDHRTFDDFLDVKDKRAGKYRFQLSAAVSRADALLQALTMYDDIRSEELNDLRTALLNHRTALLEEIDRFGSHSLSAVEERTFGVDVSQMQGLVVTRKEDKPTPRKREQNLSGANKKIIQCRRCSAYVEVSGVPPATLPGQTGPELLVPLTYCPVCGYPIGRGTSAERVRI